MRNTENRILLIDDNPADIRLMKAMLADEQALICPNECQGLLSGEHARPGNVRELENVIRANTITFRLRVG